MSAVQNKIESGGDSNLKLSDYWLDTLLLSCRERDIRVSIIELLTVGLKLTQETVLFLFVSSTQRQMRMVHMFTSWRRSQILALLSTWWWLTWKDKVKDR